MIFGRAINLIVITEPNIRLNVLAHISESEKACSLIWKNGNLAVIIAALLLEVAGVNIILYGQGCYFASRLIFINWFLLAQNWNAFRKKLRIRPPLE